MMKKLLISIGLCMVASSSYAQKWWNAEEKFDEGKYTEAAAIMDKVLTQEHKDTEWAKLYNLAANIQIHLYNPELVKAAQGQPFDTTLFVSGLDKAVTYFTKSHEYDVKPNAKGKVKAKFIDDNHTRMKDMLKHYNFAAQFLLMNKDMDGAVTMFRKYIEMPDNPVFSKEETDSIRKADHAGYAQTAFNIAMIRFEQKNWKEVLENVDLVLNDTAYMHDAYVMKMQALLETKDTADWVLCAQDAVAHLDDAASIAQSLLYYYVEKNLVKDAQDMANKMVANFPNNKNAWYMKGCVDLNLVKDFETARADFAKTLAIDPNHYESNMNTGVSFINEVISRRDKGEFVTDRTRVKEYNASIEKMREYYKKALPYFEKARMLAPDRIKEWGPNLQNVYSNLEMKDKVEEIKALMN